MKQSQYIQRTNTHRHKRSINKKEATKKSENVILMEEYLNYVNLLCNSKNTMFENQGQTLDRSLVEKQKEDRSKQYLKSNTKVTQNENQENKHIFKQILDKGLDNNEGKDIFVLSDEIESADPEKFPKDKRIEILLTKLIDDKNFINDKTFGNNINDLILNKIYIALSPDAKKLVLEDDQTNCKEIQSFFHHLIGFNYGKYYENPEITNEILTYLNNNLITIDELNNRPEKIVEEEEELPAILTPTIALETDDYGEDKLIFEYEKKTLLGKENDTHNQIVKAEEFCYEKLKENPEEVEISDNNINNNFNNNINQIDDIIDVFKSREFINSNLNEENPLNTSTNKLSKDEINEEVESKNLNESLREYKQINRLRTLKKSGNFNYIENTKGYASKGATESLKEDGPKHRKNMSSLNNPFIKNYEAEIPNPNVKGNKRPSNDKHLLPGNSLRINEKKSTMKSIEKVNLVDVFKKQTPNEEIKDKKKLIKVDKAQNKFSNFGDENSDW